MGGKSKPTNTRTQIRWAALWMTPWVWVIGTVTMMWFNGRPFPKAAAIAVVAAVGGLVVWLVYHTVSRRNDGLGIFIMALVVTTSPSIYRVDLPLANELTHAILQIVIQLVFFAVISLFFRERRKGKGQADGSPLWDAQIDPPPSP